MSKPLDQLVDDYYRNSPDWPLSRPEDLDAEADAFLRDGGDWTRDEVFDAIAAFWKE